MEERRLKLLTYEGNGLKKPEIVKLLTVEFKVSRKTIYNDYNSKPQWQNELLDMKNQAEKTLNRHEQIYRKAVYLYTTATTMKQKLAALNLMRRVNKDQFEMVYPQGLNIQDSFLEPTKSEGIDFEELNAQIVIAAARNLANEEADRLLPSYASFDRSSTDSSEE